MSNKVKKRDTIVMATLPHVVFDGWTMVAVNRGAEDAGFDQDDVNVLFPRGVRSVVRHWLDLADRQLLEDIKGHDLESMRIRDRIAFLVRTRLERWAPHREAVRRALALSLFPGHAEDYLRAGYSMVDAMWREAGDRSTDYNFYTKRGLLAVVYSSTLLVWLDDRSEGFNDTWAFMDRRIADVMKIPKFQSRIKEMAERLPSPIRLVQRVRSART